MRKTMALCALRPGQRAVVRALALRGPMRRRLRDLGLVEGTELKCLGVSPLGDPMTFRVRGAVLALRNEDSGAITVEPLPGEDGRGGEDAWV